MTTTFNPADKNTLRRRAYDARAAQPDRAELSERILARAMALPEYQRAQTVLWYISCRSEVITHQALERELDSPRRIVVPYCTRDSDGAPVLGLWQLTAMDELAPGTWNILEPPPERWAEPERQVMPDDLDLILVPGVAFSPGCDRLGNGAGYYDRLLSLTRPDCLHVGIGFECQLFESIPVEPHDRPLHRVVTEHSIRSRT